ncbi:MAG: hypothetical protein LBD02_04525 [Christensenellaceae bacterium]|nr:hypothetical protein [Christensenellaceae bacterium]
MRGVIELMNGYVARKGIANALLMAVCWVGTLCLLVYALPLAIRLAGAKPITQADFRAAMEGMGYCVKELSGWRAEWKLALCCPGAEENGLRVEFIDKGTRAEAVEFYNAISPSLDGYAVLDLPF